MELKIKHCKRCGALTPSRGNVFGIKKLKVKTRDDLIRIIGGSIKIRCHNCEIVDDYDSKDIVAISHGTYRFYGIIYGLLIGILSLIGVGMYHKGTLVDAADLRENSPIVLGFLIASSTAGFSAGSIADTIDKRKAKIFNMDKDTK